MTEMPAREPVIAIELVGHLSADALERQLAEVRKQLTAAAADARPALLVDASRMTDYDHAARELFVRFGAEQRKRVRSVAIVTENKLWLMVITAMSLASGQSMRGFGTREQASAWLAPEE
jgi:ABC-type transporter Mla MlaB component